MHAYLARELFLSGYKYIQRVASLCRGAHPESDRRAYIGPFTFGCALFAVTCDSHYKAHLRELSTSSERNAFFLFIFVCRREK